MTIAGGDAAAVGWLVARLKPLVIPIFFFCSYKFKEDPLQPKVSIPPGFRVSIKIYFVDNHVAGSLTAVLSTGLWNCCELHCRQSGE